jgi:hypothetical protein
MTDLNAGQPATGWDPAHPTPSMQKIWVIERKYGGKNPERMISSDDVQAAIAALDERHGPDIAGRTELAGFLAEWSHDTDWFLPADKAALKAAILKGIDSPAALADQPKSVQAGVLQSLAFGIMSTDALGLSKQYFLGLDFSGVTDANAKNVFRDAVNKVQPPEKYSPKPDDDDSHVERADLNGQPYGYSVTAGYDGPSVPNRGDWTWSTTIFANAYGQIVAETEDEEAPDPPED